VTQWWIKVEPDGPASLVNNLGRKITIPLRCGRSRVGRGDAIRWSLQVARGLSAQLNGSPDPKEKEFA
jgi:hypothetical protein